MTNDEAQLTVWLHSDASSVFGDDGSRDRSGRGRAYRRLVREHHPDAPGGSAEGFTVIQQAARIVFEGEQPEVVVDPTSGDWWSFVEFVDPPPFLASSAVVGLVFEIHDLEHVPLRVAVDHVSVAYGDVKVALPLRYSRSFMSLPVLRAKTAAMSEAVILTLMCLAFVPLLAIGVGLTTFLLSNESAVLTWASALLIASTGYGLLIWALWACGKPIPYPRRAVWRIRTAPLGRRSLPRPRN